MNKKVGFHSTVMTPNGPGIVQGLLTQNGKESILVSHDPEDETFQAAYGSPLLPGEQESIWVLYAYHPAALALVGGAK